MWQRNDYMEPKCNIGLSKGWWWFRAGESGHIIMISELLAFRNDVVWCHALLKSGCQLIACMRCYQQQTHSNALLNRSVKKVQAIDVLQQLFFVMCHGLQVHKVPSCTDQQQDASCWHQYTACMYCCVLHDSAVELTGIAWGVREWWSEHALYIARQVDLSPFVSHIHWACAATAYD